MSKVDFKVLEQYEGVIDDVADGVVYSRIISLGDDDEVLCAEIPLVEFGGGEIVPGMIFYWIVGDGKSEIQLKKEVVISDEELTEIKRKAAVDFAEMMGGSDG